VYTELFSRVVDVLQQSAGAFHPSLRLGGPAEGQGVEDEIDRESRRQQVVACLPGEPVTALVCVEGRFLVEQ